MSTYLNRPGFETLKAIDSGRSVRSADERYETQAKLMHTVDGDEYLVLRVWYDEDGGRWSHIVLDPEFRIVAQGRGRRESDSWSRTLSLLPASVKLS